MRLFLLIAAAAFASAEDRISTLQLPFDAASGYLPALLQSLHIPVESQIAVFSKTSIQSLRIEPAHPRVLYFNDSVIVGSVHGGFLEIAAQDAARNIQFYALQQRPDEHPIHRDDCLHCHKSGSVLLRSVIPTPDGIPSADSEKPWGGWFVTGKATAHLGNTVFAHSEPAELIPPCESDIVALTVFAHQTRMMNLLAHPGNVNELVDHLLFLDEAPLASPVEGSSRFAEVFEAAGPRDRRGRGLRQFDLKTRLMRYPCSYMIYTAAFDALPSGTKDAAYRRMWSILSGAEPSTLSSADRQAVVEILRDTKPDLPAYFVSW